jgi:hypothetical protein
MYRIIIYWKEKCYKLFKCTLSSVTVKIIIKFKMVQHWISNASGFDCPIKKYALKSACIISLLKKPNHIILILW